jgi:hypothetical protein
LLDKMAAMTPAETLRISRYDPSVCSGNPSSQPQKIYHAPPASQSRRRRSSHHPCRLDVCCLPQSLSSFHLSLYSPLALVRPPFELDDLPSSNPEPRRCAHLPPPKTLLGVGLPLPPLPHLDSDPRNFSLFPPPLQTRNLPPEKGGDPCLLPAKGSVWSPLARGTSAIACTSPSPEGALRDVSSRIKSIETVFYSGHHSPLSGTRECLSHIVNIS